MSLKIVFTVAVLSVALTALQARAGDGGEGRGDPFAFAARGEPSNGQPFVADTGSESFPGLTGQVTQRPALAMMAPAFGTEAPVQSVASLPRGFEAGTPADIQAQRLTGYANRKRVTLAAK